MKRDISTAAIVFVLLTIVTGLVYPGVVTGIAQLTMRDAANGSLIVRDGKAVGSTLIGQPFSDPKYFWGRPSATGPQPYNGLASSGSNQGTTNPALADAVKERVAALKDADPDNRAPVPQDLVTASGQRARSAHRSGGRRVPGAPCCARAWPGREQGAGAGDGLHGAASVRRAG